MVCLVRLKHGGPTKPSQACQTIAVAGDNGLPDGCIDALSVAGG
jgi:hypothetical protein